MAQQSLTRLKEIQERSISTQTDDFNKCIQLSSNKKAVIKYSKAYKCKVLSFNVNKHKNFILTPLMWKTLQDNVADIEKQLGVARTSL